MVKSTSYYDWTLSFRKKSKSIQRLEVKETNVNSLGITEIEFKEYLKDWKKKNLLKAD